MPKHARNNLAPRAEPPPPDQTTNYGGKLYYPRMMGTEGEKEFPMSVSKLYYKKDGTLCQYLRCARYGQNCPATGKLEDGVLQWTRGDHDHDVDEHSRQDSGDETDDEDPFDHRSNYDENDYGEDEEDEDGDVDEEEGSNA